MARKLLGLVCLAATTLVLAAAPEAPAVPAASARTVTAELVRGRFYYGFQAGHASTQFTDLTAFDTAPGSSVGISCRPGAGRPSCPVAGVQRTTPASGLIRFARDLRGDRLRPADMLDLAFTDTQGRRRVVTLTVRSFAAPRLSTRCYAADGTETACIVGCLVGAHVPPGDPCEDAGKVIHIPRSGYHWFAHYTHKSTRFLQLRVAGVHRGVDVVLICHVGPKANCPFSVRSVKLHHGAANIVKTLSGARFKPGSALDLEFFSANSTAEILRFVIRDNRAPRVERRCQGPADPAAHGC